MVIRDGIGRVLRRRSAAGGGAVPPGVWVGLSLAVVLDVPVQLMWKALMVKFAAPGRGPRGTDLLHVARWFVGQARTWGLLGLFLAQFLNWIWVLGNADLTFAQPFTALSYVAVAAGAVLYMGEHLSPARVVGIGTILAGVLLVGSTDHRTTATVVGGAAAEPPGAA